MSQILSSEEVGALLEDSGGQDGSPSSYDLAAPVTLVGDRLAVVETSCRALGSTIGEVLTSLLMAEKPVKAEFTGILQQPVAEMVQTLTKAEPLGVISSVNGTPIGAIQVQSEMMIAIVDRAQGGDGTVPEEPRDFTQVELSLIGQAMEKVVALLDRATPLSPLRFQAVDEDPTKGRLAERGGSLVTASFRVTTPQGDALFRLLMAPPMANRLVVEPKQERPKQLPDALRDALDAVPVPVRPSITGASISLEDLRKLQPGMVIQFEPHEHDSISLNVGGLRLAAGKLTRESGQRHFELEQFFHESSNEDPK